VLVEFRVVLCLHSARCELCVRVSTADYWFFVVLLWAHSRCCSLGRETNSTERMCVITGLRLTTRLCNPFRRF
jgi:hypothetical protein